MYNKKKIQIRVKYNSIGYSTIEDATLLDNVEGLDALKR